MLVAPSPSYPMWNDSFLSVLAANLLLEQVTEQKVRVLGSYFSVFGNQSIVGV